MRDTYKKYEGLWIPKGAEDCRYQRVSAIAANACIECHRGWSEVRCTGISCSSCICSVVNAAIADEYFNTKEKEKVKKIFTAGAVMPHLYPGMLVRTISDRWIQFITTRKVGGVFYGHYLIVDNNDRVAITASLTDLSKMGSDTIKEVYQRAVKSQCDVPAPLSQTQIKSIIRGARNVSGVEVWCNPKYLPRRKMTVAEIEEKLGFNVEIISEKEN